MLAEAVWTSADGLGVQVRIGVHAVRRISGATVLDWSVTPLAAPNLQPGDPVPPDLDLGLSRPTDELPLIWLLDVRGGRLYRPLASPADPLRCVCTPLAPAADRFRIGHTTVLQVAFPALPGSTTTVDVALATLAPFGQVPITPAGQVPVAGRPAELARPPDTASVAVGTSAMFRYGPGEQVFRLRLHRVAGRRHLHHPGVDDLVGDRWRRSGRGLEPAVRRTGRRRHRGRGPAAGEWSRAGRGRPPRGRRRSGRGWWPPTGRRRTAGVSLQPARRLDVGAATTGQAGRRGHHLPAAAGRGPAGPGPVRRAGRDLDAGHAGPGRAHAGRAGCARRADDLAVRRPAIGPGWTSASWPTPVPATEELPADAPGPYPFVR